MMEMTGSPEWIFETITKHTLDMIAIIDENRKVHFMTPIFYEIFNIDPNEISKMDIFDILHPDDREMMESRHKIVISSQQKSATEYRVIDKFGEIRHFESKTTPIPSEKNLTVVAIRDITERKKMEHELEARKNRYEQLQRSLKNYAESLASVMKVSDLEEKLVDELKKMIPFSEPSILIYDRNNLKQSDRHQRLSQLTVGKREKFEDSIFIKIGERSDCFYVLSLCESSIKEMMDAIWLETLIYYTVMVFENLNVLENLMGQLESALQSKETPQWVLRLLFNLQEQQRLNLSSDLHDTVLQDQIDLYRRLESLLNNCEFFDCHTKKQLKSIEQGLLDTIHQIRATCNELRPPLLIELGLGRALENLFDYTQVTSTYKIISNLEDHQKLHYLDEEQIIGIYRIVQELLNNADKHAKATEVHFGLVKKDGLLSLTYKDNGIGFDNSKLEPSFNHMGLTNIKHRAQSLGGNSIFDSQTNQGLSVKIDIPIMES